ncbi:MAG: molybdopterin-dependent oxidoreductase [Pseudomonadota bacterium]
MLGKCHELAAKYNFNSQNWHGINLLYPHASTFASELLGFTANNKTLSNQQKIIKACGSKIKLLFLFGADEFDLKLKPKDCFIVYFGHHGDRGAKIADVILPTPAFTEKDGTYINLEGRAQHSPQALPTKGEARSEFAILTELATKLSLDLGVQSITDVTSKIYQQHPELKIDVAAIFEQVPFKVKETVDSQEFCIEPTDFFLTDPICRASKTMAECTANSRNLSKASEVEDVA